MHSSRIQGSVEMGKGALTLTLDISKNNQCKTKSAWQWKAHATVNSPATDAHTLGHPYTTPNRQVRKAGLCLFTCIAEVWRMPVFNTGIKQLHKIGGGLLVMKDNIKNFQNFHWSEGS